MIDKEYLKSMSQVAWEKLKEYFPIITIFGVIISIVIAIGTWLYEVITAPEPPPPPPNFFEKAVENPFGAISNIFETANEIIKFFSEIMKNTLSEYPYLFFLLIVIIMVIINNTSLKRKNFEFVNFIFLLLSVYLFLFIFVFNSDTTYKELSFYIQEIYKTVFEEDMEIVINRSNLLQLLTLSILLTINSRFLWIVSIFLLKLYIVYVYGDEFLNYYSLLSSEKQDLFKIVVPISITAPYVLVIWLYRDNDKYFEQNLRQQEINLLREQIDKENSIGLQQISLADRDYYMRQSELRSIKDAIGKLETKNKS